MFERNVEGHAEIGTLGAQGNGTKSPEKPKCAGFFDDQRNNQIPRETATTKAYWGLENTD